MKQIIMESKQKSYCVISWNVNSYNDDIHDWLKQVVLKSRPDIIFLSETKKKRDDLVLKFSEFTEYNAIINANDPARWHGVAMLIRKDHMFTHIDVKMNIGVRSDNKTSEAATGRIITILLNDQVYIIGSYTPNSGQSDNIKYDYRTNIWDPAFVNLLEVLRSKAPTMWIGDINVALDDIDVSNPKLMSHYAGFTTLERANFKSLLSTGNWVDVWRHQNPKGVSYTWCGAPRKRNHGLRLDNVVVSGSLLPNTLNAFVIDDCAQSTDHLPVGAYINI